MPLHRHIAGAPFAYGGFSATPPGQVVLKLKTAWRDGAIHIVMSPRELIQRLATLGPSRG